ncbi:class V aminotransferase [Sphingomonas sp. ASV193]|uniref:kynureninase/PvdN C-terminal domain-containing protein n=1 Tax=Sphingomonas sp. ASV193 TaxID=3144405 RepID=UPI0032E8BD95
MSFKPLFSRSLGAAPGRLHFAAHSHHLWPDASFDGQVECWEDAARLADRKWDRVMGEVWPEAQAEIAAELGSGNPSAIVFADNTHSLLLRLAAACPRRGGAALRVLTTDGEFHSARRQLARWEEGGEAAVTRVAAAPFDTLPARLSAAAQAGSFDLVFASQLLFGSGAVIGDLAALAGLARPEGPWAVIDGYHSFMAIDRPFRAEIAASAFFLGGGYKYAMSGEGMGFMHCPPGFGPRPPLTGWYAEFEDLTLPPGAVGYAPDAMRFMGATFDPSALYRFAHVRRMLAREGLTTATISAHAAALQARLLDAIGRTPLAAAELLNPLTGGPHARFLAFRDARAQGWCEALAAAGVVTDVRGDVLRIGFGLYHDAGDVDALVAVLASL